MMNWIYAIIIIVTSALVSFITNFLSLILALPFIISIFLGVRLFTIRIGGLLTKFSLNELIMLKKIGNKILKLSDDYYKKFEKIEGAMSLFPKVFLLNFLAVLFLTKTLGPAVLPDQPGQAIFSLLLAIIVSIFSSVIITPLSIGLYALDSTQVRILDLRSGVLDKPGKTIRALFRGIFGYGNLIVLFYVFMDALKLAKNDVMAALRLVGLSIALVYGTLALPIMLILIYIAHRGSTIINTLVESFNTTAINYTESSEEALRYLRTIVGVEKIEEEIEKPPEEVPEEAKPEPELEPEKEPEPEESEESEEVLSESG